MISRVMYIGDGRYMLRKVFCATVGINKKQIGRYIEIQKARIVGSNNAIL